MTGRFTRLFPEPEFGPASFDPAALETLAAAMTAPAGPPVPENAVDPEENWGIPAAYTYLAQFVDHDLTFDPTSQLRESLTPRQLARLADFRTPRFDLDNVYGRGPGDQPYMYDPDGVRMLLGPPMSGNPFDPGAVQLPRGPSGRALIGDPRNDENRIVAQLHAAFLRFHNQVAYHLGEGATFQEVRRQVRWHYQWVLVNDLLDKVLTEEMYRDVFADPHKPEPKIPGLRHGLRLMPVEFSAAVYRFGHSMVRPVYRLNTTVERRPIFSDSTDAAADLGGLRPIPADWAIDWQFFIDIDPSAAAGPAEAGIDPIARKPQLSYKIDTSLANPLGELPDTIATTPPPSLAWRNLMRGETFGLPSGQDVAKGLGITPLSDEELVIGKAIAGTQPKPITEIASGFAGNAPLWAYILSEAQVMSWRASPGPPSDETPIKLGPVGGRIVADVFAALLIGDPTSYLHHGAQFAPIEDFTDNGQFGLAQLIKVALRPTPQNP